MASPLSPSPNGTLNLATPQITRHLDADAAHSNDAPPDEDADTSSPFISSIQDSKVDSPVKENVSLNKRHSRIMSGNEIAPLKILSVRDENVETESRSRSPARQSPIPASPRKAPSVVKRFPVKIMSTMPEKSPEKSPERSLEKSAEKPPETNIVKGLEFTLEDAMQKNGGLKHAMGIFEDDDEPTIDAEDDADDTSSTVGHHQHVDPADETAAPDESMVSTFSTFSAVPNMTMFARIGHSPTRYANMGMTPTSRGGRPDPSPNRTPRPPTMNDASNTTSLMEFTEQFSNFPSRNGPPSASRRPHMPLTPTTGDMPSSTPQRQQSNLLDFDIPPLPTPRSIPTVTPRELESLKSSFLSEISSLKASLLGKEAEVGSLKTAIGDAEKRVGQCMEQLRETQGLQEALTEEKETWEKRGREMEAVLRQVKTEIVHNQREKEELEYKLDESEKRREAAEMMAQDAESKMAGMRAGKATADMGSPGSNKSPDKGGKNPGSREVEIAVERVARELHALYKSKHETKVIALKKSYENRWEKRVHELENKIEDLLDENEKLRLGRDATMTKVDPTQAAANEARKEQAVKDSAQIKELGAEIEKLEASINSVKQDNQELIQLLEKERVEKGELVQLAEEMMSMQHSFVQPQPEEPPKPVKPARPVSMYAKPQENGTTQTFRTSIGRPGGPSGIRTPGRAPGSLPKPQMGSRIGGPSLKSGGPHGGLPRPGSGTGSRSGIMSSIERMGTYKGRGD
ncbi:uncharacterized protein BCR38DRAFT_445023 [Pseudomassariella vexata]|uniref:Central kinetochore-associated-domain-containing protein n=1 Tax=Pseudomassariella vexata TaxID=1141098 RepID=A0A1Y2DLL6_9PEZI|nr:uncharacterized protein BCR38DRAFT_445023 [Pseudomassariella vexata]ORY59605.1 hypothetical protein BCR38DRAFT_445023 [Pseudomassariella vexata]